MGLPVPHTLRIKSHNMICERILFFRFAFMAKTSPFGLLGITKTVINKKCGIMTDVQYDLRRGHNDRSASETHRT
jgi:hypothetical protein